jgi:hypothetical protein
MAGLTEEPGAVSDLRQPPARVALTSIQVRISYLDMTGV